MYRDAALADSSKPMLREEDDSRSHRTKTILATVLGIVPMEIPAEEKHLAPPPVEMETDDYGVRRRPTYKDSFGSIRPLVAAPAVENNESAPDEMDAGAPPRLTYMDSVGMIRPLAQVVASEPPSIPQAQDIKSAPDAIDTIEAPRLTYVDSVGRIRTQAAVVEPVPPSIPPTQKNESAPEVKDAGAARRPLYKESVGSVRFSAAAKAAAVRSRTQKNETAPDEDDAVRIRRPVHMNRADSHPSAIASMPQRLPLARDNAATLAERETEAVSRPMYKDCFGSARLSAAEIPTLSAAEIPPITNVPLEMKLKEVDEVSDTFYDEDEMNEDEVESDNERARASGEWIMVLPESKNRRRLTCRMTLFLVVIVTVVAVVFGASKGGRTDSVSPQSPTSNALQDENTEKNQVAIEVQHDLHPEETGWTLRDSTGELIAGQSTGSFSTKSGKVVQIFDVAIGTYTFEMTDTFGDGICCRDGAGSFQITVNGETAVSNDGQFGDTVQETFEVTTPNS
jgi:hypothetical protein